MNDYLVVHDSETVSFDIGYVDRQDVPQSELHLWTSGSTLESTLLSNGYFKLNLNQPWPPGTMLRYLADGLDINAAYPRSMFRQLIHDYAEAEKTRLRVERVSNIKKRLQTGSC